MRAVRFVCAMVGVATVAGCGFTDRRVRDDAFSIVDSAGVQIALNEWVGEDNLPEWRLEEEPFFTVGDPAPSPAYELFRVTSARSFPDGRVVMAVGREDVRIFSPEGRHLVSFGRRGSGPTEFGSLWGVQTLGDTAVQVIDNQRMQVMVFDAATGELRAQHRHGLFFVESNSAMPLGDDSFIGIAYPTGRDADRWTRLLVRVGPGGAAIDTLTSFRSTFVEDNVVVSFSPNFWSTAAGDKVWAGSGDKLEIFRYRQDGTLEQIIRSTMPAQPVTDTLRKDVAIEDLPPGYRQRIPTHMPLFGRLRATPSGWLWVRRYMSDVEQRTATTRIWDIYDPDGRHAAFIRYPLSAPIYELGEDYLLGVFLTDLDVETVRKYRIIRPR